MTDENNTLKNNDGVADKEVNTKNYHIEFFKKNGFICFPIPKLSKVADYRYKASKTDPNQKITFEENYGIIAIDGKGTGLLDLDDKERDRKFAEENIANGYMVIETGRGWHIPVKGLSGNITKIELYDYKIQEDKIIEFQGPNHYAVGVGSVIHHEKLDKIVSYENKGGDKIWDAKGKDFHDFIDFICKRLKVTPSKKSNRSGYLYLRNRFKVGKIPTSGQSNDYFLQAAVQCNTDGLSIPNATEKIRIIYDKWCDSRYYSQRPWNNIERKIEEVYENNKVIEKGRPKKDESDFAHETALKIIQQREIYSDKEDDEIYENKKGFLELINHSLHSELQHEYTVMTSYEFKDVLFKLVGLADDMPETDKNLIMFDNGAFDKTLKKLVDTEGIADMGFKQYKYLEKSPENIPKEFEKLALQFVPESQHPRVKACLRSIFQGRVDSRISVLFGISGVGKSTFLEILCIILGQYALSVELDQLFTDNFIRANIKGKYLVNIQDMPDNYIDFSKIKNMTGEGKKSERGFREAMSTFDNKIKICGSANNLFDIPEKEKNAMFTRRLSLIHNTKKEAFEEDPDFAQRVAKEEGEKIISWILNFSDEECQYEDKTTIEREWCGISAPEIDYLNKYYKAATDLAYNTEYSVMAIREHCKEKTGYDIPIKQMIESLTVLGYVVKFNIIKNMSVRPQQHTSQKL
ncbi:MAG: hypothetical protein HRU07_09510 [Nitrosopumilus sp.]|nr:DUF5906 domain-containing protein [Nitrosopumilus sp.]NRA06363.1 hypothetical protein [Nitrosopumilus sp.]